MLRGLLSPCKKSKDPKVKRVLSLQYHVISTSDGNETKNKFLSSQRWQLDYHEKSKNNSYHIAASQDDGEDIIKQLISNGCTGINHKNVEGKTPLTIAIENRNSKIFKLLFDAGAICKNTYYDKHRGPLHLAAENVHLDAVRILIKKGADVNALDKYLISPLLSLVSSTKLRDSPERKAISELLLKSGANVNQANISGKTAFHFAISNRYFDVASMLIDAGANFTIADRDLQMLLLLAIREKNLGLTERLVKEKSADINALDEKKLSPLCHAIKAGDVEIAKLLHRHGASTSVFFGSKDFDALFEAIARRNYELVNFLLKVEPNLRVDGFQGRKTYLQIAASYGQMKIIERLMQHGANMATKSKESYGILYYAADKDKLLSRTQYVEFLKILMEKEAATNISLDEKTLVLDKISVNVDAESFRYFVDSLIDFSKISLANAYRILYEMMEKKYDCKLFKFLVESGKLDIKAKNANGFTALHYIANRRSVCSPACLKYLLKGGFDPDCLLLEGFTYTPLHLAIIKKNFRCVRLLLHYNADVNARDRWKKLILSLALEFRSSNNGREILYYIVRHIAILELAGKSVDPDNYTIIKENAELRELYKKCRQELISMHERRISDSLTFFDLLRINMKQYSRNLHLIEAFEDRNALSHFVIYADMLTENFYKLRKRPRLCKRAELGLKKILKIDSESFQVVFNTVFEYLSNKDLRNLAAV